MEALTAFPDVEDVLLQLLDGLGDVGTFLPSDLKDRLDPVGGPPGTFHRVYRFAGPDDGITDRPVIGIATFASTRAVGQPSAEAVRQRMIAAPHTIATATGTVVIDTATTAEAPHEVPWGDSAVRRWEASYRLTLRR